MKPYFIELTFETFSGAEVARLVRVDDIQMLEQMGPDVSAMWLRGNPKLHVIKDSAADVVEAIARHAVVLGAVR